MEVSKDGTKVRSYSFADWRELDPKTGLVALDEGLYFHFKEFGTDVVCSIRTNRWWGPQTLYSDTYHTHKVAKEPEVLQKAAVQAEYQFNGSREHQAFRIRTGRKDKTRSKLMGSYANRNINEVDSV